MNNLNLHVTKEQLEKFHTNQLSLVETTNLMQHISQCTYCADQFAESFESHTIHAPANLKEEILVKAEKKIQLNKPMQKISAQKQFFLYSTKVCAAMCGALVLLFTSSFQSTPNIEMKSKVPLPTVKEQTYTPKKSILSSINSSLNQFTVTMNGHINSIMFGSNTEGTTRQEN